MAWRIGVDIGGTFTDVVLVDEASGRIGLVKLLTTSDDFSRAVVAGLKSGLEREALDPAIDSGQVALLAHATTIVTNLSAPMSESCSPPISPSCNTPPRSSGCPR